MPGRGKFELNRLPLHLQTGRGEVANFTAQVRRAFLILDAKDY